MQWTNAYSMEQLGPFLKDVRRAKGYTQDDFAELIGVSHATLSSLENGNHVSSKTLERAIGFLGLRLVVVPKNADVAVEASGIEVNGGRPR